ncbi:hypothetical protein FT233_11235 [Escherichia coli]|nr:hypothetical protein DQW89_09585 [Escherichia coli]EEV5939259.1 hypothetical protein [Escherichia coli]EEV6065336.1 hypothetical protein [Escherichia coli]EEW0620786.1 hypothetical protein [Escherichia coli]EFD6484591.1 hypothetical protein [Escherichia coli]
MPSASITLLNGSPFHSPVTRKCIYHLHKTKLAVASSDKRKPALGGFAFVQIAFTSWRSVHPYRYTMGCFPWACLTTARDSI